MSRRRGRRTPGGPTRPLSATPAQRVEHHPDGDWLVRSVTGSAATKAYRCPGCDQEIRPATPHVVTWPADGTVSGDAGLEHRRHWHAACWAARDRRGPR